MAPIQQCQQRSRKEQRLEARVTPEQRFLIERGATLRGTTVTEFVVKLEALRKRRRLQSRTSTFYICGMKPATSL